MHEGLNREQLMEKHGLTPNGLKAVLAQIRDERDRRAAQIIRDFRSGMEVADIAARNGFPEDRFLDILRHIVCLDSEQLSAVSEESEPLSFRDPNSERRRFPRIRFPVLTAPVQDMSCPGCLGTILDLSERGVGLKGIAAQIDDEKTFLITESDFDVPDPIVATCRCRWTDALEAPHCSHYAGFEITDISEPDERHLRALIHAEERLTCSQP